MTGMTADQVLELYSVRDAARLFGLAESRLRYWIQAGFLRPSVRQGGRFYYTFADLVGIKAAVELLGAGVPMVRVRRALDGLRGSLPASGWRRPRACACSATARRWSSSRTAPPTSRTPASWSCRSRCRRWRAPGPARLGARRDAGAGRRGRRRARSAASDATPTDAAVPQAPSPGWDATEPNRAPSAYQHFLAGCRAEDGGDLVLAEKCYWRALELEPSLAAAHTNLGNLAHRRGSLDDARRSYQRALDLDPDQPEARFNLANLLDEMGQTDLALAELLAVCSRHPSFADAHYNLGLLLYRVGGAAQARHHLGQYLSLDSQSEWARRAKDLLTACG